MKASILDESSWSYSEIEKELEDELSNKLKLRKKEVLEKELYSREREFEAKISDAVADLIRNLNPDSFWSEVTASLVRSFLDCKKHLEAAIKGIMG